MLKNVQILMWAVMQDFKAHGYFGMDILMDIPTVHHQVHHQAHHRKSTLTLSYIRVY